MVAVTVVVPVSSPIMSPTVTGLTVPLKLAPVTWALNVKVLLPWGEMWTCTAATPMSPKKTKPWEFRWNEPAGMVIDEVPTRMVTGSVNGAMPSLPAPSVKVLVS